MNTSREQLVSSINYCLTAINESILHFNDVKDNIINFSKSLEKRFDLFPNELQEFTNISEINYIAILTLEKLGITNPSQNQIDTMETVILLCMHPDKSTYEKIVDHVKGDNIANRILMRKKHIETII